MRITVFNTKEYDKKFLNEANKSSGNLNDLVFLKPHLDEKTAILAKGSDAVCCFVNDTLNDTVLKTLSENGIKLITMRCSGFNNIDLQVANDLDLTILRVPAYSPYAVAEHAMALIFALCRQLPRAYSRVRDGNFSLNGLMGFDLHGKTFGVIGIGAIGKVFCRMLGGFDSPIIGYDPYPDGNFKLPNFTYGSLDEIFEKADIISIHCPLTPDTHHIVNEQSIQKMKRGVMIVNTSRGGLIDTPAAIEGLKSGQIGSLGIDVYEEEDALFFEDHSDFVIQDDIFTRLLTFPNVLVTGHQAFFTKEALQKIAETTISNLNNFTAGTINTQNLVALK